jgi:hypothetical protein
MSNLTKPFKNPWHVYREEYMTTTKTCTKGTTTSKRAGRMLRLISNLWQAF